MSHSVKLIDLKDQRALALGIELEHNRSIVVPLNHWACRKLGRRSKRVALLSQDVSKLSKYFYQSDTVDPTLLKVLAQNISVDPSFSMRLVEPARNSSAGLREMMRLFSDLMVSAHVFIPNLRQVRERISNKTRYLLQTIALSIHFFWGNKVVPRFYNSWFYKLYMGTISTIHLFWGKVIVRHWNDTALGKIIVLGESNHIYWRRIEWLAKKPLHYLKARLWFAKIPFYWLNSKKWLIRYYWNIGFTQQVTRIMAQRWKVLLLFHKIRYYWGVKIVRPYYESRWMRIYYSIRHIPLNSWLLICANLTGLSKIYYFLKYQWHKRVLRRGY